MAKLWIVEMWNEDRGQYEPCPAGCSLTRSEGRDDLAEWRCDNPDDTFRLVAYAPARGERT